MGCAKLSFQTELLHFHDAHRVSIHLDNQTRTAMRFGNACLVIFVTLVLAGCSSIPKYPKAPMAATQVTVSEKPSDLSTVLPFAKRVGTNEFYLAQFGGSSAALGILAGPIGAAIGTSLIEAQSTRMAQSFSTADSLNISQRVQIQLKEYEQPEKGSAAPAAYSISSAIVLQLSKDEKMRTSLVIRASNGLTGDKAWEDTYFYHLSYMPSREVFDKKRFDEYAQNVSQELDEAVITIVKVMMDDLTQKAPLGNPMALRSDYFGPFYMINYAASEISGYAGHHIFRIDGKPGMMLMPYAQGIHAFKQSSAFEKYAQR